MDGEPYFWAKTDNGLPGCSVWEHAMATAEVARLLLAALPRQVRKLLPAGTVTLVAAHDVGKISPGFQTKCPHWVGPDGHASESELRLWAAQERQHAFISEWVLRKTKRVPICWAECAGAHHGNRKYDSSACPMDEPWLEFASDFLTKLQQRYGKLPQEKMGIEAREKAREVVCPLVSGLMVVSDWIASNEACFPVQRGKCTDFAAAARKAVDAIGIFSHSPVTHGLEWGQLFPSCPHPHPIQQYLWSLGAQPGIYLVEDAMGGGKTEAALALAYHLIEAGQARGLYFALPTQTTSNRIFFRVRDFLENMGVDVSERNLQLAHGNSWLMRPELYRGCPSLHTSHGDKAEQELRNWFASSRCALLAEYGVGTIDQALLGEIAVKHSALRRFALAGKVVVLDEVHSYDVYTGTLVAQLVRHLRACAASVVILSATLTRKQARQLLGDGYAPDLEQYPLVSSVVEGKLQTQSFPAPGQKEIRLHCLELPEEALVREACQHAEKGQCVLWIRNTVKEAQRTFRLLLAERLEGGPEIGLLHARFPFWRREQLEERWISRLGKDGSRRPQGCVLVATQVVEQSIDIDADFLITDLAPTDMLLQRAGRLWRHDRPLFQRGGSTEAEMMVAVPQNVTAAISSDDEKACLQALGSSRFVYDPFVLLRTLSNWSGRKGLRLPADICSLIEATYHEPAEMSRLEQLFLRQLKEKRQELEAKALNNTSAIGGIGEDIEGAGTRYGGMETADVLLLARKPERSGEHILYQPLEGEPFRVTSGIWDFSVAKSIARNIVHVPEWMVQDAKPDQSLSAYAKCSNLFSFFQLDNGNMADYIGNNDLLRWHPDLGVEFNAISHQHEESEFMY